MPKSLAQTLDDPDFRKLKPEVQRSVLTKMGVSSDRQDKLLAKITQTAAQTPTQTPAVPQEPFLARASKRAGSQIKGALVDLPEQAIKDISSGTAFSREAHGPYSGVTGFLTAGPRAAFNVASSLYHDWTQDPANVAGDVVAGAVLGKVGDEGAAKPKIQPDVAPSRTLPAKPAPESSVPPELRKLSKSERAKYQADVAKIQRENSEKLAEHQKRVEEIRDRTNREHEQAIRDHAEKEAKSRAAWAEKMHKATKSEAEQIKVQNKKAVLERGSKEYTRLVHDNIRATHDVVRGQLDQRWNQLRGEMRGQEVSGPGDIYNGVRDAENEYLRGAPQSVQQFRQLIRELGIKEFVETEDGTLEAAPEALAEAKPMDWETARVHYSAIGDKLASGGLPGNVYQALKSVHTLLDGKLGQAAEQFGHGAEYGLLKRDWSQYMKDWKDTTGVTGSPLARALRSPDPGYTYMQIIGKSGDRMLEIMSRYKSEGARPDLAQSARRLGTEAKAMKVPGTKSRPGKYQASVPPSLRELGTPAKPKLKPIPQPAPSTKLGTGARAGIRTAGHFAGLGMGTVIGHPFVGWGAGGAMSEAAIRMLERRRAAAQAAGVPPDMVP